MVGAIIFLWSATRGYRLQPWRSPYLRWRLETYSGVHADEVKAGMTGRFLWRERRQFFRFLRWTGQLRRDARGSSHGR